MIRELNLTNRQSMLDRFDAWLYMVKDPGAERTRWDVRVRLRMDAIAELNLTEEWECWVDVYKSSTVESFKLGDGQLKNTEDDRFATHFDSDVYPLLRIKLVAKNDSLHKILASRDRVNPEQTFDAAGKREHLLPVRYEEIGQIPWQVRDASGTRPVLIVNSNFHRPNETVEALVKDRLFCALVLPEAYRQILRARLFAGMIDKDDLWLRFTSQYVVLDNLTEESTDAEKETVLELAVKKYCERLNMLSISDNQEVAE